MGKVKKMNKAKVVFAVSSIIFIQNIVFAASVISNDLDSTYKDGANTAKSYIQQPTDKIKNLDPKDKFYKYYTDSPSQEKYFKGVTQGDTQDLAKDAVQEVKSNEAGKATLDSAESHPKYFISPDSYEMQKANSIISHAANISTGQGIDCNQSKICHTDYVKQFCNEEVRYLQKLCDKTPKVEVVTIDYPNCQKMVRTQGWSDNPCPGGYARSLYADMIDGPTWDDLFFCTKSTPSPTENSECYSGGYYIARTGTKVMIGDEGMHNIQDFFGTGSATVPKHLHARIKISNVYSQYMVGTIINVTTGQTLYNQSHFTEGQTIELPFSDTQDQAFRFYATKQSGWRGTGNYGVMVLYIDHQGKQANVTWEEICHDNN